MNNLFNLIPWPEKLIPDEGFLSLQNTIVISLPEEAGDAWKRKANVFKDKLKERLGIDAGIISGARENTENYSIIIEHGIHQEEAYSLSVQDIIRISAGDHQGLHNAFMTLLQLMTRNGNLTFIPKVYIEDSPRFSWRGTLIDPARNFLPVGTVKEYIDYISELKLNILHWHLVDDQGWRMESLIFPRLHLSGGKGGYYTQAEIREIITYAEDRNVMILPEIDMPGHTSAMLSAYPELSCTGEPVELRQRPGIFASALCVSNEAVYDFIDRLIGEVAGLFPFPFIHIGSDEVVAGDWLNHDACTSLMNNKGIRDKTGLHAYFVERVNDILLKHKRKMIAWDEVTHFMPDKAIIQAWRNHKFALVAAEKGHDAIVSPTTHCYYDYPHIVTSVEKVYSFEPVPENITSNLTNHILGTEANLWGEWITPERLPKRAFPRMLAHAEVCWTKKENRNFANFKDRMHAVSDAMKQRGAHFGTNFEPFLWLWFGIMKLYEILFIRDKDKGGE